MDAVVIENRFCWPAQDRVRADPPSKAPRISPVFTASVFFRRCRVRAARVPQGAPVWPDWRVMGEQDWEPETLGFIS
jgi:hypothetical protein